MNKLVDRKLRKCDAKQPMFHFCRFQLHIGLDRAYKHTYKEFFLTVNITLGRSDSEVLESLAASAS
jgi:hypothetical protein